jgi:hypothetical protein
MGPNCSRGRRGLGESQIYFRILEGRGLFAEPMLSIYRFMHNDHRLERKVEINRCSRSDELRGSYFCTR